MFCYYGVFKFYFREKGRDKVTMWLVGVSVIPSHAVVSCKLNSVYSRSRNLAADLQVAAGGRASSSYSRAAEYQEVIMKAGGYCGTRKTGKRLCDYFSHCKLQAEQHLKQKPQHCHS